LGAGLKFTPMSVSPEESQFLQTQKYGAAEVCRLYGVPPQKVAAADIGSSMVYASVEAAGIDFLSFPITWWADEPRSDVWGAAAGPEARSV